MDPFVESLGIWRDFQLGLLASCRRILNSALPRNYIALADEEIVLVDLTGEATVPFRPDVLVAQRPPQGPRTERPESSGGVAVLEPAIIPLALKDLDELHHRWIEIQRLPERTLVTVIEVLSPTNKYQPGRSKYLEKRNALIEQLVHLVEIDLLLAGPRLPMARPLPRGDYYAMVSRAEARPNSEVYAWSIRQSLPPVPIPLLHPDEDARLDLAVVVNETYEWGRYDDAINYTAPLTVPLRPEDRAWAEEIARGLAQAPPV